MIGLPPNAMTYSVTLGACARSWQWDACLQLLADMQGARLSPNAVASRASVVASVVKSSIRNNGPTPWEI